MLYDVSSFFVYFFFNDTATTEIYTLSLHDALPIWRESLARSAARRGGGEECGALRRGPRGPSPGGLRAATLSHKLRGRGELRPSRGASASPRTVGARHASTVAAAAPGLAGRRGSPSTDRTSSSPAIGRAHV